MEKPNPASTAKVAMSETGMATIGMSVTRQFWRKRNTTATTSAIASSSVITSSLSDSSTKSLMLKVTSHSSPSGKLRSSRAIDSLIPLATCRALAPGSW